MQNKTKKEIISYTICGIFPTAVNFIVYFLCRNVIGIHYIACNVIAWLVAVMLSFYLHKQFVFVSKSWAKTVVRKELCQFLIARIFSVIAETVLLFLLVEQIQLNDGIIKIIVNILITVANFFVGKRIFKKKTTEEEHAV